MRKIEFAMNKVFTFGHKDAVHRFMIRNHFLSSNQDFKSILMKHDEKCIVTIKIKHTKDSIDIDNLPKVIIDSFSGSQIKRDMINLKNFRKDPTLLNKSKQKEYQEISSNFLFDTAKYQELALFEDDTIKYIAELHCYASVDKTLSAPEVNVTFEIHQRT